MSVSFHALCNILYHRMPFYIIIHLHDKLNDIYINSQLIAEVNFSLCLKVCTACEMSSSK